MVDFYVGANYLILAGDLLEPILKISTEKARVQWLATQFHVYLSESYMARATMHVKSVDSRFCGHVLKRIALIRLSIMPYLYLSVLRRVFGSVERIQGEEVRRWTITEGIG